MNEDLLVRLEVAVEPFRRAMAQVVGRSAVFARAFLRAQLTAQGLNGVERNRLAAQRYCAALRDLA